jgi:hypothetical protein
MLLCSWMSAMRTWSDSIVTRLHTAPLRRYRFRTSIRCDSTTHTSIGRASSPPEGVALPVDGAAAVDAEIGDLRRVEQGAPAVVQLRVPVRGVDTGTPKRPWCPAAWRRGR